MNVQNRIRRIKITNKDISSLSCLSATDSVKAQSSVTFTGKVVIKPWGYEFEAYEGQEAAIWILYIKKGHATSLHCHPRKTTSLIILAGKSLCNTFRHRRFLSAGDAIILSKSVFHSTKSLSEDGLLLMEVESPVDKGDLVRYRDDYGREGKGYEDIHKMMDSGLERYGYFRIEESNPDTWKHTKNTTFTASLEKFVNAEAFQNNFIPYPGFIYCVCKGKIIFDEMTTLNTGECDRGEYFSQATDITVEGETILMKVAVHPE